MIAARQSCMSCSQGGPQRRRPYMSCSQDGTQCSSDSSSLPLHDLLCRPVRNKFSVYAQQHARTRRLLCSEWLKATGMLLDSRALHRGSCAEGLKGLWGQYRRGGCRRDCTLCRSQGPVYLQIQFCLCPIILLSSKPWVFCCCLSLYCWTRGL